MTGKSFELPHVVTTLGGMVTWAGEDLVWHTEVFDFLVDARDAFYRHVQAGDSASLARLVRLDRRQALDLASHCVPSSKNRQIRLSNFDTLMLTASGRAGAVAAGPPAA
ncbi:MAG: hypothetical protein UDF83_02905 [Collinsella stercoris]|nr:hypothetical protein [Collinsella stercoris]